MGHFVRAHCGQPHHTGVITLCSQRGREGERHVSQVCECELTVIVIEVIR